MQAFTKISLVFHDAWMIFKNFGQKKGPETLKTKVFFRDNNLAYVGVPFSNL